MDDLLALFQQLWYGDEDAAVPMTDLVLELYGETNRGEVSFNYCPTLADEECVVQFSYREFHRPEDVWVCLDDGYSGMCVSKICSAGQADLIENRPAFFEEFSGWVVGAVRELRAAIALKAMPAGERRAINRAHQAAARKRNKQGKPERRAHEE